MDIGTIVDEYSKESMLQANPTLLLSLNLVRTALHQEISCLNSLETYIHLLMPQMEDGNNFGVTVRSLNSFIYSLNLYHCCRPVPFVVFIPIITHAYHHCYSF